MTDRDLIVEGRQLYTAAMAEGKQSVVLKSDGETDALTDLLIWAGNKLPALLDELEVLRASLAAIKAADPDLFDPRGGTSRGGAYETYGSAGHRLREKYLAAIGLAPEDEENDDE